jgi:CheY-like chemotaxis protein
MPNLLIIDDNAELARVLASALQRTGHKVWVADNGKEGLKLLSQHAIDLMITDIVMPEQDGIETIQLARRANPQLRVITISGDAPRHAELYLSMTEKLGADRTLLKPFRLDALLTAVQEVLQIDRGAPGP